MSSASSPRLRTALAVLVLALLSLFATATLPETGVVSAAGCCEDCDPAYSQCLSDCDFFCGTTEPCLTNCRTVCHNALFSCLRHCDFCGQP